MLPQLAMRLGDGKPCQPGADVISWRTQGLTTVVIACASARVWFRPVRRHGLAEPSGNPTRSTIGSARGRNAVLESAYIWPSGFSGLRDSVTSPDSWAMTTQLRGRARDAHDPTDVRPRRRLADGEPIRDLVAGQGGPDELEDRRHAQSAFPAPGWSDAGARETSRSAAA
jgi:hypothetical protein